MISTASRSRAEYCRKSHISAIKQARDLFFTFLESSEHAELPYLPVGAHTDEKQDIYSFSWPQPRLTGLRITKHAINVTNN
jgi:hypothetical protein